MTPLDAARRLAACQLLDGYGVWCREHERVHASVCAACHAPHAHAEDCPVPLLPHIVAALEAAQVLVREQDRRGWLPWRETTLCLHMGEPCPDPPDPRAVRAAILGDAE